MGPLSVISNLIKRAAFWLYFVFNDVLQYLKLRRDSEDRGLFIDPPC